MRRADKILKAKEAAEQEALADDRDQGAREAARREWGQVRKAAREAFLAKGNWKEILDRYRDQDGFYTAAERSRMCADYTDELVRHGYR